MTNIAWKNLVREHGVALGDRLDIRGTELRVARIARGGNAVVSQFAWASLADVRPFRGAPGVVNYFGVRTGSDGRR